jgi:cupin 2 domain-containing protein
MLSEFVMTVHLRNLLWPLPAANSGEAGEVLLAARGVRLERIVSLGHASPEDFWYDQRAFEWVMVLSGSARLAIEGETGERTLAPGDALTLPAHCRHRVTWTDPDQPTVWLALFLDADLEPKPA